jgi:hypothetical protein
LRTYLDSILTNQYFIYITQTNLYIESILYLPSSSDTSEPEFTIVSRKRARCRGRPPAVSTADTTGIASISEFFTGLGPSTQPGTIPSLPSTPGPAQNTEVSMAVTDW